MLTVMSLKNLHELISFSFLITSFEVVRFKKNLRLFGWPRFLKSLFLSFFYFVLQNSFLFKIKLFFYFAFYLVIMSSRPFSRVLTTLLRFVGVLFFNIFFHWFFLWYRVVGFFIKKNSKQFFLCIAKMWLFQLKKY
jgi:hypothetical protein